MKGVGLGAEEMGPLFKGGSMAEGTEIESGEIL
jgi:hypothetical protein